MIQRWKREKSAGDQNCSAELFPFVFQKISDDDFCQTDFVPSNLSDQLVEECEKNNISKTQHDPTVGYRDMATGVLLFLPKSAPLSLAEFSIVSHSFLSFFFFSLNWWPLAVLNVHFPLITIISLIYAFIYFILFFM
jgi:hypothetical protein